MTVLEAEVTHRLDAAGNWRVRLPLTDQRTAEATVGRYWLQFREGEGLAFAGIIENVSKAPEDTLELSGPTILGELLYTNTLLNRQYTGTLNAAFDSLLALASGWTRNGSNTTTINARFDGESVLKALLLLIDQPRIHLRELITESGGVLTKKVDIGAFGDSSGVTMMGGNPDDVVLEDSALAYIESLQVLETVQEVWNWLIPLGSGDGKAQLTLQFSSRTTPYTIHQTTGPDGATIYYLADGVFIDDTFSRADDAASLGSTETGQAWTALADTWGISSNKARCQTATPAQAVAVVDALLANVAVAAKLTTVGADGGLVIRATDNNNYILLSINTTGLVFWKKDGGGWTNLGSYVGTISNDDLMRLTASGNTITAYQNGTQRLQVTEAFNNTATKVGIRENNTTKTDYDNFAVSTDLTASDASSVATYGRRQRAFVAKDVGPLSNTKAALIAAANALYDLAVRQMTWWKDKQTAYRLSVRGLKASVKPGDKIRLRWRGYAEHWQTGYVYLDVNTELWVLERTRRFLNDGTEVSELVVSDLERQIQSTTEAVIGKLEDTARAFRTRVQTSVSNRSAWAEGPLNASYTFPISLLIDDNVTQLLRCKLRINPRPIRSTAAGAASGGSSTPTSSGGSSHSHSVSGQSATAGGGQTSSGGGDHDHDIGLVGGFGAWGDPAGIATVTWRGGSGSTHAGWRIGNISSTEGNGESTWKTYTASGTHTHTVSDHTHSVSGATSGADTAHTHTVTIAAHTHTQTYGIYEGTSPAGMTVTINGVDRTVALGGPWAAAATLDITEYLLDADGVVVQQVHTIAIGSTQLGRVECWLDIVEVVQAIVAS